VKRTSLSQHPCSIARTLDVAGEWWTPLIVRDVAYGLRRFAEIQEDLGISANVLTDRLETLVREGILETRIYQERPERHEYVLTRKGAELVTPLIALMRWGDRWARDPQEKPVRVLHEKCREEVTVELRCPSCERDVEPDELLATPGDPVSDPPREGDPGHISGRTLYAAEGGVPVARP
jgi:DNA-binding HxlR family transcriptional regulator